MATTLSGAFSNTVEARLSGAVAWSLPALDPTWKLINSTWTGVSRDGVGQDWTVIHVLSESLHGAFKWVSMAGAAVDNTTLTMSMIPTAVQGYPGLEDVTLPGYLQKKVTLVEGLGNLFVPQQYLRADKLEASVGNLVLDLIKGAAMNTALADIAAWYSSASATNTLSAIGAVADTSFSTSTATLGIHGSIGLFASGQHLDVYDYLGTTKRNSVQLVVDGVRYLPDSSDAGYGEITLKTKDGSTFPITVSATDLLVLHDSIGYGPWGPDYWMASTGTIFNVNVATHQQFQSLVTTSTGDLDETALNKYLARLWKAYGPMDFPDTILTTMGVTQALLDSSYGLADRFVRQLGQRNQLSMGFEEPGETAYMFMGMPLKWIVSRYMHSDSNFASGSYTGGRLWAMKFRGQNITRYMPPPLPGTHSSAGFGAEVEFLNSGGPNGIFAPYKNTEGRSTQWYEAPFNRHCQYMPKSMVGWKAEGITEIL